MYITEFRAKQWVLHIAKGLTMLAKNWESDIVFFILRTHHNLNCLLPRDFITSWLPCHSCLIRFWYTISAGTSQGECSLTSSSKYSNFRVCELSWELFNDTRVSKDIQCHERQLIGIIMCRLSIKVYTRLHGTFIFCLHEVLFSSWPSIVACMGSLWSYMGLCGFIFINTHIGPMP